MAKANFKMPDGTIVNIDGSVEEIYKIMQLYGGGENYSKQTKAFKKPGGKINASVKEDNYLIKIVNIIKECDEAEKIEKNILDQVSQVNRTLLPLYIVHKYLDNAVGLQSGDISKITKQLGIPIARPNISKQLSGSASRYVMGDTVKKPGQVVKYKLNHRGVSYFENILLGKLDD